MTRHVWRIVQAGFFEVNEMHRYQALRQICERYAIEIVYVFGSRGREVRDWFEMTPERCSGISLPAGESDVDVGVKPARKLTVRQKAELAIAFEDLLGVQQVDLVSVPETNPFLAANIIRGERLYADNNYLADEYDLYILRRAGDLAPLERERQQLILDSLA